MDIVWKCSYKRRAWLPDVAISDGFITALAHALQIHVEIEGFTDEFRVYRVYKSGRREWIGNYQADEQE